MQGLNIDQPAPEPFWNRRTILFAAAGFSCWLRTIWLGNGIGFVPLVFSASVVRLAPVLLIARERRSWPAIFAMPYPFALAFLLYSERNRWLPENLALQISNPTAFLIGMSAVLFASILWTGWLIGKAVTRPVDHELRTLAGLLFGLTAVAVVLSVPHLSVFLMRYIAQPIALAGYAAVLGRGLPPPTGESVRTTRV